MTARKVLGTTTATRRVTRARVAQGEVMMATGIMEKVMATMTISTAATTGVTMTIVNTAATTEGMMMMMTTMTGAGQRQTAPVRQ